MLRDLCLYNPVTGEATFFPAANKELKASSYVLVTADNNEEVRILAVASNGEATPSSFRYQIFSSRSGSWGPVRDSPVFQGLLLHMTPGAEAVCGGGGAVHVTSLLRNCRSCQDDDEPVQLGDVLVNGAFCSGSGCLLVQVNYAAMLLVDVETGSARRIKGVNNMYHETCLYPYEMNFSSYIVIMKRFQLILRVPNLHIISSYLICFVSAQFLIIFLKRL